MTKAKDKSEPKGKGGRPSKYNLIDLVQVEKLCRLGATDKEICDFYDISESVFNKWKTEHPELMESLKKGKMIADAEIANKLYQRAFGYEHPSEEIKVMYDKDTNQQKIERVPIIKHYPPDTTALIFWLKNRQPSKWRDKQEVEHSGEATIKTFVIRPASTKKDKKEK